MPLEKQEMDDVQRLKECLNEMSYKFLMNHTRSEEVYLEAWNAHKAHLKDKKEKETEPVYT
jgi:hypothetical protein